MNIENVGSPIAKIEYKNDKKKDMIVSVSSDNSSIRKVVSDYHCLPAETIQQIPDKSKERGIYYITGASGSGKSYYTMNLVNEYKKMYPKNDLFLLSSVEPDGSAIDKIKGLKRFKLDDTFLKENFKIEDFKDCLIIFDDTDVVSNKFLKAKLTQLLDLLLQTGRHTRTSVVYTSHLANAGFATKQILNEAHSITIFPKTLGGRAMKYLLDNYLGFDKQQIKKLKKLDSRWVTIVKTYPMCILAEKDCYISQVSDD
jgi:hypothetical protein